MRVRTSVLLCALTLCTSCVLPARSAGAYEEKAATTARAVLSAVEDSRLAISAALRERAFAPSLTVMFGENEGDASSAIDTLGSIQPPDDESQQLFDELDGIVQPAVDALRDLRILARGGKLALVHGDEAALEVASDHLNAFIEAHS